MSTPTITRRTAWARIVLAMAEGLPDPQEIDFHASGDMIFMKVDSAEALAEWATYFDARADSPFLSNDPAKWIHKASTSTLGDGWHGWYVSVTAYVPGPAESLPVDEDMSAVRALADEDFTQGEGEVGASSAVEAPTAPGDGHVYECCGKVGRISRHNAWCETGQTPADRADEPVWVAAERKGIPFHALSDRSNLTDCHRSAARGSRLHRVYAEQFAQPCPRCYPPTAVGAA